MSNLKWRTLMQLRQDEAACIKKLNDLDYHIKLHEKRGWQVSQSIRGKVGDQKERLKWIHFYIDEKEKEHIQDYKTIQQRTESRRGPTPNDQTQNHTNWPDSGTGADSLPRSGDKHRGNGYSEEVERMGLVGYVHRNLKGSTPMKIILILILLAASAYSLAECDQEPLYIDGELFTGSIGPIDYVNGIIPNLFCPDPVIQNRAYALCTHWRYDPPSQWEAERVDRIVAAGATRGQIPWLVRHFERAEDPSVSRCARTIHNHIHPVGTPS